MKLKIQFLHIFQLSSEGDQGVLFVMYIFLQQSHGDLSGKIWKLLLLVLLHNYCYFYRFPLSRANLISG